MDNIKPNIQRADTAIALIWIVFVIDIVRLFSESYRYYLLQQVNDGGIYSKTAEASDKVQLIAAYIYSIAFIISIITFLLWFRRAYYNLEHRSNSHTYNNNMAVKAWFIPVVNLFIPYMMMKELFRETINFLQKIGKTIKNNNIKNLLNFWWSFVILKITLRIIVIVLSINPDTHHSIDRAKKITIFEALETLTMFSMIEILVSIILALFTIKIIKSYIKLEWLAIKKGV